MKIHNQAIKHRLQAGWTNFALLFLCRFRYARTKQSTQNLPLMAALSVKMKEILFGVVAGLLVALPQGMRDIPSLSKTGLPIEIIQIIGVFGTVGGFIVGYIYSVKSPGQKFPINGYSFLLVGTLSIGIPILARHFDGEILSSLTMPGLFFTSIGLSMILGGAVRYVLCKNT